MTGHTFDLEQARAFLTALGTTGDNTFQTLAEKSGCRLLPSILHGPLEALAATLASCNRQGAGVFVLINEGDGRGRKRGNIVRVRALFADFDGAPLPTRWRLEPQVIVRTSPGRYHAYWRVQGVPLAAFRAWQRAIAQRCGSDASVSDPSRVMRLPGSRHLKGEPFPVELHRIHPAEPYTPAQLRAAWPRARPPGERANLDHGGWSIPTFRDGRPEHHPAPPLDSDALAPHREGHSGRHRARHRNTGPGRRRESHPPTLGSGDPPGLHPGRRNRNAFAILERERARVAAAPVGTRNSTLNRSAFRLGRLVGAGLLGRGGIVTALLAAARCCGLGESEAARTILSGLEAGTLAGSIDDPWRTPTPRRERSRGRIHSGQRGSSHPCDGLFPAPPARARSAAADDPARVPVGEACR